MSPTEEQFRQGVPFKLIVAVDIQQNILKGYAQDGTEGEIVKDRCLTF
jgi:hypothetical protein